MRRKDREVTDFGRVIDILEHCDCCRIGLIDAGQTYIVPLNFGYEVQSGKIILYFHSACEGRKINLIKKCTKVSFEADTNHQTLKSDNACGFSYRYQCIMGEGNIQILDDRESKIYGLRRIMFHYSGKEDWQFDEGITDKLAVLKLEVNEWSCKEH